MEIMKGDKGRPGGSGSEEQPRMETMKGDELGRQGGSGSGDHEGRQGGSGRETKGDKAAAGAKSSPEWRPRRGTLGDKAAAAAQNGKGDKGAAAAKSAPE